MAESPPGVCQQGIGTVKSCTPNRPAQKRYLKRVILFTALYLAGILAAETFLPGGRMAPVNVALALVPGLAIVGLLWAVARLLVEETDEFMRMLIVRQALVATGFALGLATVWGFMEIYATFPHLPAYWIAGLWFFGLFFGSAFNRITYGAWG